MTELKTLKDFEIQLNRIHFNDLKAEAVKWVREILSQKAITEFSSVYTLNWIKHFFNLTEEDLK